MKYMGRGRSGCFCRAFPFAAAFGFAVAFVFAESLPFALHVGFFYINIINYKFVILATNGIIGARRESPPEFP